MIYWVQYQVQYIRRSSGLRCRCECEVWVSMKAGVRTIHSPTIQTCHYHHLGTKRLWRRCDNWQETRSKEEPTSGKQKQIHPSILARSPAAAFHLPPHPSFVFIMITPKFQLSQTDSHLIVVLHVPHIRVSAESLEVVIVGGRGDDETNNRHASVVHLSAPPYLLKLGFGPDRSFAEGAEEACAAYDPQEENATLTVKLLKRCPEWWDDLHLIGKFVVPTSSSLPSSYQIKSNHRWLQEIVVDSDGETPTAAAPLTSATDDPVAWPLTSPERLTPTPRRCGFARLYPNPYVTWSDDACNQLAPERGAGVRYWAGEHATLTPRNRRRHRRQIENQAFSADRYLQDCDIHDDYIYQCLQTFEPHWQSPSGDGDLDPSLYFTSDERLQLATIPYPLLPHSLCDLATNSKTATTAPNLLLLLGVVDVLFAYVYDHQTTQGEPTVESAWTLSTLSATLSWMEDWLPDDGGDGDDDQNREDDDDDDEDATRREEEDDDVSTVITSSLRLALIYPYLRNLELAMDCMRNVATILRQGTSVVVRCLLHVRSILHKSDAYYLSNKLFIDPYLAWIQRASPVGSMDVHLQKLAEQLLSCLDNDDAHKWKSRLDLNLIELEATAARMDGETDQEASTTTGADSSSSDDDSDDSDDDDNDDDSSNDDSTTEVEAIARSVECSQTANENCATSSSPLLEGGPPNDAFHNSLLLSSKLGALSLDSDAAIDPLRTQVASHHRPLIQELD